MNVYEIITERMIKRIEETKGLPWRMPWKATGGHAFPVNARSQKRYRGINVFMLMQQYECQEWATFKQIQEMGGNVRKGEKASPVIFWKKFDGAPNDIEPGEELDSSSSRPSFMLRYYNVFNLEQTEGIDYAKTYEPAPLISPIERAAEIVAGYKNAPALLAGGGRAFYRPSNDSITMPDLDRFSSAEAYYGTLFHEMIHSTGHKSRLDRSGIESVAPFGSPEYSREELVAEMGAAFLKAHGGIESADEFDQSAAYLTSWLKAIKQDPKALVIAAAQAQKAADHILGRKFDESGD